MHPGIASALAERSHGSGVLDLEPTMDVRRITGAITLAVLLVGNVLQEFVVLFVSGESDWEDCGAVRLLDVFIS